MSIPIEDLLKEDSLNSLTNIAVNLWFKSNATSSSTNQPLSYSNSLIILPDTSKIDHDSYDILRKSSSELTKSTLPNVKKKIKRRRKRRGDYIDPVERKKLLHKCTSKCCDTHMPFSLYVNRERDNYHFCIDSICNLRKEDTELHKEHLIRMEDVYICKKSGKYHICGQLCDYVKNNIQYIPEEGTECTITGKRVGVRCHTLSKEVLSASETYIIDVWKHRIHPSYEPVDPEYHTCETESTERIPGEYISDEEEDESYNKWKMYEHLTPEALAFKGITLPPRKIVTDNRCHIDRIDARLWGAIHNINEHHICINGFCDRPYPQCHHFLLYEFKHVYVCRETGIPHFCGPKCDQIRINKDKMKYCRLTGFDFGEVVMDNKMAYDKAKTKEYEDNEQATSTEGYVMGIPKRKKDDETDDGFKLDTDNIAELGEGAIIGMYLNETKRKNSAISNETRKDEFHNIAYIKIYALFSETQLDLEENIRETSNQKELDTEMTRYLNRASQTKKALNTQEMLLIALGHHKRKANPIKMNFNDVDRRTISLYYAKRVMTLWYIIRTKTEHGRNNPSLFPHREFIIPALSVMQNGFEIAQDEIGYRATVIEPDKLLQARRLDGVARIANKFSYANSEKRNIKKSQSLDTGIDNHEALLSDLIGRKKSQSDKIRTNIEIALRSAIKDEHKSPEELKLESLHYEELDIDEVFRNDEKAKRIKKQKTTNK
jgi:hypothetical protein